MGEVLNIHDFELLTAYLSGELTEREMRDVNLRAEQDVAFAAELKRLEKVWAVSLDVDTDAAWKKLDIKINQKTSGRKISMRFIYSLAAVLVGFLVISVFVFRNSSSIMSDAEMPSLFAMNETVTRQLPDGSEVSLNKNSRMCYSSVLNLFGERIVYLEGEGYFDVERNEDVPFVVRTKYARVTVLGTKFNVNAGQYETKVFVSSGKVRVEDADMENVVEIAAGQQAELNHLSDELIKLENGDMNCVAWKTLHLEFNETLLFDALKSIEAAYGVELVYDESLSDSLKISASFDELDAESVLEIISLTLDIDFRKENEQFVLYEK